MCQENDLFYGIPTEAEVTEQKSLRSDMLDFDAEMIRRLTADQSFQSLDLPIVESPLSPLLS